MCGICGLYNFKNDKDVSLDIVKQMAHVLQHRGPDEEGYYASPCMALGHKRLKIIDLETGRQPISNEDGSIYVILNGEIYNYENLRRELEKSGHIFRSKTDTEVIVHLYEEKGAQCLEYLRGMFALAIWDERNKELFLARDRLGKKPIYYYECNGSFGFASEIKALLQIPHMRFELNKSAIVNYLSFSYIPPPQTIFQNIYKVLPAHYVIVNKNGMSSQRYWRLNFNEKIALGESEITERIKTLLMEATEIRMQSDVPLGAFLSGGLDSSIVVALMSAVNKQKVKTFSIGFEHRDFNEISYACAVAKQFNTEHHEFIVKPSILPILDKLIWYYDQPFADSSSVATFYLAEMAKKYVTVALTGDGGDENFAGYPRHNATHLFNKITSLPSVLYRPFTDVTYALLSLLPEGRRSKHSVIKLKKFLRSLKGAALPFYKNYHSWFRIFNDDMINDILTESFKKSIDRHNSSYLSYYFDDASTSDILDRILYTDIMTYLPDDLLVKMDTATMANSLEARSPLLDHTFMEFTAKLPADLKSVGLSNKYIMKQAFKGLLPKAILNRSKMGFGVPVGEWFHKELRSFCTHILLDSKTYDRGFFNKAYVRKLIDEHLAGKINHGYHLWNLLVFELWCRKFLDHEKVVC